MRTPIIWTIFRKEITEALRDRVALLVVIGLPLLIYPMAFIAISGVTKYQAGVEDRQVNAVAVWGTGATPLIDWLTTKTNRLMLERWQNIPAALRSDLEEGRLQLPAQNSSQPRRPGPHPGLPPLHLDSETTPEDAVLRAAREVVSGKQADAVLIIWPGFDEALQKNELGRVSVYYDSVIPKSAQAWSRLEERLDGFRQHLLKERQHELMLPSGFMTALDVRGQDVAIIQRRLNNIVGQVLPGLLIALGVIGAIVAAADMTAGEKDRATMQTLLCAPVRSFEIVMGKFLAIWAISLISAMANLVGFGLVISRLTTLLEVDFIQLKTLTLICVFLLPATWTIAALFPAVAVLARDVKDAGNFLSAAALAVLLPVGAIMTPGVELDPWTCCVPILNLALLMHALMTGPAASHLVFLTLLSSLAYAALALALAARMFGREQILLGGAFSWRDLLRVDRQRPRVPSPGLVLTLFPVAMVGMFYVSLALLQQGLQTIVLATEYGVLLLPVVVLAAARKFPFAQTFSLHWPHWRSIVGSILIGLTASAAVAGLLFRVVPPPDSVLKELEGLMQLGDQPTPLWQLWLVLAVTPALCEETFFRGLMLSGLRRWGPWKAIIITALLFGVLHGSIYRLLPTFILGLVLGYAVWRSRSLYCSILIHVLNNGLIVTLVWSNSGKDLETQSIPWTWTLGALAIMAIGLALFTRPNPKSLDQKSSS